MGYIASAHDVDIEKEGTKRGKKLRKDRIDTKMLF